MRRRIRTSSRRIGSGDCCNRPGRHERCARAQNWPGADRLDEARCCRAGLAFPAQLVADAAVRSSLPVLHSGFPADCFCFPVARSSVPAYCCCSAAALCFLLASRFFPAAVFLAASPIFRAAPFSLPQAWLFLLPSGRAAPVARIRALRWLMREFLYRLLKVTS